MHFLLVNAMQETKWAKAHWAITANRLPAMKNYFKSVIGNLNIKVYISPKAPVNMNSSELSYGIWETSGKTSATVF